MLGCFVLGHQAGYDIPALYMTDIHLFVAFTAGVVSFLSPCVLPIMPGFFAYIAGESMAGGNRLGVFLQSVFFVLGFSTVFALLGVLLNTLLQAVAYGVQVWLARIGGALIIIFGLYLTGLIRIPFLERSYQPHVVTGRFPRFITAFLFGAAFAAGWTPCVGAVLGGILGLAATAPASTFSLLLVYALGLGLPFLMMGLFTAQAEQLVMRYGHILKYVTIIFGALLILIGILAFTQELSRVANFSVLNRFLLSQ